MGEISYRPLIEDMRWSFSRIECFNDCPYRWYLRYIYQCEEEPKFYSSYGKFMHKIIEQYYKGEITKEDMCTKFLFDFRTEVQGIRPPESTVQKYIERGIKYLKGFTPLPYKVMGIEKRVEFDIDGISFVGFIDYLGEDDNGSIYIVDNKSRDLKPRSKRKQPTVKDQELDEMLKQLYIYSAAVKQEYGRFPKALYFNCFKAGTFIEEPFNEETYNKTIEWAKKSIENIKDTDDFYPNVEFFSCYYICPYTDECCYWSMR